jgi:hypothetical protein
MLYPLSRREKRDGPVPEKVPIMGFAISFPAHLGGETVEYIVSSIYQRQEPE